MNISDYSVSIKGSGEPIIFLPAGGFRGNQGLIIADFLSAHYEVHMLDLPGYGQSKGLSGKIDEAKIASWLDNYFLLNNIDSIVMIGHSLGGAVALVYASYYPDKVKKLVLLDQGHKAFPRIPIQEFGLFAFTFPILNLLVKFNQGMMMNLLYPLFVADSEDNNELDEQVVEDFCSKNGFKSDHYITTSFNDSASLTKEGLALMFSFYNWKLPQMLNHVNVDILLIYGNFKKIDHKEYKRTLRAVNKIKNHKVNLYSLESGHYVLWSAQFPFQLLFQFFKTL